MESLEARCNPAAEGSNVGALVVDPFPPHDPGQAYTYTIDPRTSDADAGAGVATGSSAGAGLPNVQVRDLELNQTTNTFAGQTVRIRFEAADASTASGTHYFDGRFLRADDLMREQVSVPSNTNNYFTDDYSLTVGDSSTASVNVGGYGSNYKYIEDPSRSSVPDVTGDGFSDLVVGTTLIAGTGAVQLGNVLRHEVGHGVDAHLTRSGTDAWRPRHACGRHHRC